MVREDQCQAFEQELQVAISVLGRECKPAEYFHSKAEHSLAPEPFESGQEK